MEYKITNALTPDGIMIRQAVFVQEQGFKNEFDDIDDIAYHLVIYEDGKPAAAGRLFEKRTGEYYIGRVAVLKEYRKMRLGSKIISLLEEKARDLGGKRTVVSAQCGARAFYEKAGYTAFGDVHYDEDCPHVYMEKNIH